MGTWAVVSNHTSYTLQDHIQTHVMGAGHQSFGSPISLRHRISSLSFDFMQPSPVVKFLISIPSQQAKNVSLSHIIYKAFRNSRERGLL